MAAYIISDIGPVASEDEAAFKEYVALVPATVEKYGGRYLVRGGAIDAMEGEWSPYALVVIEFPDRAAAHRWYASPEYGAALKVRDGSGLRRGLICVEGASGSSADRLLGLTK